MSEINGPLVRDPYPDLSRYEVVWPVYLTPPVPQTQAAKPYPRRSGNSLNIAG
jgi:hypothetical protein